MPTAEANVQPDRVDIKEANATTQTDAISEKTDAETQTDDGLQKADAEHQQQYFLHWLECRKHFHWQWG